MPSLLVVFNKLWIHDFDDSFSLSVGLDCRLKGAVNWWAMLQTDVSFRIMPYIYWMPLTVRIHSGAPYRKSIIWSSLFATGLAMASFIGASSIHLTKVSWNYNDISIAFSQARQRAYNVNCYSIPGPTRTSEVHFTNRSLLFNVVTLTYITFWTYFRSLRKPGLKYRWQIQLKVLLIPRWPDVGLSWHSSKTCSLSSSGTHIFHSVVGLFSWRFRLNL